MGTGDQNPGEQDLCEHYQVNRTVVRQALRELEYKGVITRQKGKGAFISDGQKSAWSDELCVRFGLLIEIGIPEAVQKLLLGGNIARRLAGMHES